MALGLGLGLGLGLLSPPLVCTSRGLPLQKNGIVGASTTTVRCMTVTAPKVRRTANYGPPIWEYDYVQSLSSNYAGENYKRRSNNLKNEVRRMLDKVVNPLTTLELIDSLQRLGISYAFEEEISKMLGIIHNNYFLVHEELSTLDLFAKALGFRLLRQHGYYVPQEIFNDLKDETGGFGACLGDDVEGMLSLYEASFLSIEDETIMDEARDFTTKHLREYVEKNKTDQIMSTIVSRALEIPFHWRVQRFESRWFIEVYERRRGMNPVLLELAKLDFNMVQAIHQEDLKDASRWWKSTCWGEKLSFGRDRLMENFLWAVAETYEPQFEYSRRALGRVNAMVTTIDDIYDVYGTVDELEQFTDITCRWDANAIEELPEYMKICFLAFYNSVNEMAYHTLTKKGCLIIPYLKRVWGDLCKSYLIEAKWYHNGHTPTLEEYMNNAWLSISPHVTLTYTYFATTNNFDEAAMKSLETYPDVVRYSAMILRLADDLGTSSDELARGDTPKSIQCYMHESGASEEDAREHIKYLISETWKKFNKARLVESPFPPSFIEAAMNLGRMAQCLYHNGDGHASQDSQSKERVLSLLIEPVQGV